MLDTLYKQFNFNGGCGNSEFRGIMCALRRIINIQTGLDDYEYHQSKLA